MGHFLFKEVKVWKWGKTLLLTLPMFAVGYLVTYVGFKNMTAIPNCTEQELKLFFLYCSPNVALMAVALFLIVRKLRVQSPKVIAVLSNIAKCRLGIYMLHCFIVGFGYAIVDSLAVPVSIRMPVTATITFLICWSVIALCYKVLPQYAKWVLSVALYSLLGILLYDKAFHLVWVLQGGRFICYFATVNNAHYKPSNNTSIV